MSAFEAIVRPTNFSAVNLQNDPIESNSIGGQTRRATAAAALNIGDCVYYDGTGLVDKSAVAATVGAAFAGVVVGGAAFDREGKVTFELPVLATLIPAAAALNDFVIIQTDGIAYVRTTGVIAGGAPVIGGATAGYIASGNTQGAMLGTTVSNAAAAGAAVVAIKIDHR